ncbi:hypothetical protein ASG01_04925 [Chryseobacterium sp. Leaf180]|uniref:alpha-glutamyl/putrescinyl thymine pyrophosphorylase clade 3 protein n=1 Tax=Chryseobacterium sp. Leaf180 TaxID=1736289 RepID=UPI0006F31F23|nr:hypothetical protein [Chryseobacterium sp. Leaf180]KQR95198.1 hypothetical protein ASG01_04925 [Chryseobacterium sp. Leaf180]
MKNNDLYLDVKRKLDFYKRGMELPGIDSPDAENSFIRQFVDSYKRIKYIETLKARQISEDRRNPNLDIYDPIRASILYHRDGDINEAVWNLLLYVHFGKNIKSNYGLIQAVYGKLGDTNIWNWNTITTDLANFKVWLGNNFYEIKSYGSFGNHRKYQSLKTTSRSGTYQTFESFFNLVDNDFNLFTSSIPNEIKIDKNKFFDHLYWHFDGIVGFGRLAVFDFLCMIGKIGILPIEPNHPYLGNSGPVDGTRLLFDSNTKTKELNVFLKDLGDTAFNDYPFIMQILEDCVCNWQKSSTSYRLFRG